MIDGEVLSGMEAKAIELLIDAVAERKKYKIKDENMIKAIGHILKNLSNNESGKQLIQVILYQIDIANNLLGIRFKVVSREC